MLVDAQGNPIKARVKEEDEPFTSFHLKEVSTTTLTLTFPEKEDGEQWLKARLEHANTVREKAAAVGMTIKVEHDHKQLKSKEWQYRVVITSNKTEKLR